VQTSPERELTIEGRRSRCQASSDHHGVPDLAPPLKGRNSPVAISPRKWYSYRMNGTRAAYSLLPQFLLKRNYTVADLINKLRAKGESFDKKTIYRLVGSEPMRTINSAALGAICEELQVSLGEIITFEPPAPILKRIENRSQKRLSFLMSKNNDGKLTVAESKEFQELGRYAEELSLENARTLARHRTLNRQASEHMPPNVNRKKRDRKITVGAKVRT
jgi:DNA-binding Xre family transcriptional regulator